MVVYKTFGIVTIKSKGKCFRGMCTHLATIKEVGTSTVTGEDDTFSLKTKSLSTVVFSCTNFAVVG